MHPALTVAFTSVAVLTVLVDIIYIIVCFKALKKTFHNLSILALFFSDIILAVSSAIFSLLPKHETIGSCLLQLFLSTFGLQSNYCLIFLMCLQKYLVVKSFNFGTLGRFDKNKYIYIGGSMCLVLILSSGGLILIPRKEYIQVCRPTVVYGERFYIFVIVTCLPTTVIMVLLLIMSIIISYRLWKIYFKRKISPIRPMSEHMNMTEHAQSSFETTAQSSTISPNDVSVNPSQSEIISVQDIEIHQFDLNTDNKGGNSATGESSCSPDRRTLNYTHSMNFITTEKKVQCIHGNSPNNDVKPSTSIGNFTTFQMKKTVKNYSTRPISKTNDDSNEDNLGIEMVDLSHNTNVCSTSTHVGNSVNASIRVKTSWEIRAFVTTLIIACQTVILTGPFIASYWTDLVSSSPLTLQARLLFFIPFLFNSLSNPFIYTWRIPEIRQEFGRLLCAHT